MCLDGVLEGPPWTPGLRSEGEQSLPPQSMPLWNIDYFKPVTFEGPEGSGGTFDLPSNRRQACETGTRSSDEVPSEPGVADREGPSRPV